MMRNSGTRIRNIAGVSCFLEVLLHGVRLSQLVIGNRKMDDGPDAEEDCGEIAPEDFACPSPAIG